jgi:hypothetical protein
MAPARPSDRPTSQRHVRTSSKKSVGFDRKGCSGGSIVAHRGPHGICTRGDRMPSRGAARRKAQLAVPPGKRKGNSVQFSVARATAHWRLPEPETEMVRPKRRCSPPRARAMPLVNLRLTRHHARRRVMFLIYLCLDLTWFRREEKKKIGWELLRSYCFL